VYFIVRTFFKVKEVANKLFAHKVDIKLKKQEVVFDTVICSFDLNFDNAAFRDWQVLSCFHYLAMHRSGMGEIEVFALSALFNLSE
jgi:hypothetical protein